MKDKVYTVKEAANLLGYSTNTVYGYLRSGEIKSVRVGRGKFRIPASELSKFEEAAEKSDSPVETEEEEREVVVVESPAILPSPRPGRSLEALSGETPWHIIKLWLAERVGLPRLFDWLVALASIVLGLSMFLYNRQLDILVAGNLSEWFLPIRLTLIIAGFGLILADMIQEEFTIYKHLNNIFRVILMVVYFALAYIQMKAGDMDGLIINGLFAGIILLEAVFGVMSSTAYAVYIGGLIIGIVLAFRYFPDTTGLSSISIAIYKVIDGYGVLLNGVALALLILLVWGYMTSKRVFRVVLGVCGILLVALSVHYATESYWARSFFILVAAMIGMLLPFWEEFKYRTEVDRTLVFRMFGTILMTFSLAIILIGIVQSILLRSAFINLSEKADYGRVVVDGAVENSTSALEGLVGNELFREALLKGNSEDLTSFSKALFKNYQDFNNITIVNLDGEAVAVYPLVGEKSVTFSDQGYFSDVVRGGNNYFSTISERYPYGEKTVVVGVPVKESDGKIIGGVFASYNMNVLGDRLQELGAEDSGQHLGLLDIDGRWLTNIDQDLVGTKVSETDATYLSWLSEKKINVGYNGSGRYSVVVISGAKNIDWTVTLSQPVFAVLDISNSGLATVMFLLFVIATVVAISYALVRQEEELL